MNITIDDIHEYLMHWYDESQLSDFNMAMDSGYTQYAAYLIDSAGVIDPKVSSNPKIERAIKKLLKGYNPSKDRKECFGNAVVFLLTNTNEHAFVKNDYVDYFCELTSEWELSK